MVEAIQTQSPVRLTRDADLTLRGQQFAAVVNSETQTKKEKDTTLVNTGAGEKGFSGSIKQHGEIPGGLIINHVGAIAGDIHVYGGKTSDKRPEGAKVTEVEWKKDGTTATLDYGPLNGPIYVVVKGIKGSGESTPQDSMKEVLKYFKDEGLDVRDPKIYEKINLNEAAIKLGKHYTNAIDYYNEHKAELEENGDIRFIPNEDTRDKGGLIAVGQKEYDAFLAAFRLHDANLKNTGNNYDTIVNSIQDGITTIADEANYFNGIVLPASNNPNGYIESMQKTINNMNSSIDFTYNNPDGPIQKVFNGINKLKEHGFSDQYINSVLDGYGGAEGLSKSLDKYAAAYTNKVAEYIEDATKNFDASEKNQETQIINNALTLITTLFVGGLTAGNAVFNLSKVGKNAGDLISFSVNTWWIAADTFKHIRTVGDLLKDNPDGPITFNGKQLQLGPETRKALGEYATKAGDWIDRMFKGKHPLDIGEIIEENPKGDTSDPHPIREGYSYTWYAEMRDELIVHDNVVVLDSRGPEGRHLFGIKA